MSITFLVSLNLQKIDKFTITDHGLLSIDNGATDQNTSSENSLEQTRKKPQKYARIILDGYCLSCIRNCLETSPTFRRRITDFWTTLSKQQAVNIYVTLVEPQKHILDLKWANMIDTMVVERRELDNSFSWMSTLGGAYSALGDYIPNFAVIAGRISIRQLELSLRLGDTPVVIRCCLYYALSLIQQGKLRDARQVVQTQYRKAKHLPIEDRKLINICKGIWSRLQYEWELKKRKRKNVEIVS